MKPTLLTMPYTEHPQLHHIGIAVRSIDSVRNFYEKLGLPIECEETVPHEQVKVASVRVGESLLELLEPTQQDSPVGRFLEKRGEGVHHLALQVQNIEATLQQMKESKMRLVNEEVRIGADGHRYFFLHPSGTGGILLEIVEEVKKNPI